MIHTLQVVVDVLQHAVRGGVRLRADFISALRFDHEDQNSLWYYNADDGEAEQGFKRILAGPAHPDYLNFCQGPGHGTGYLDQIIMQAAAFLHAINSGETAEPGFEAGLAVSKVVDAAWKSHESRAWVSV